MKFISCLFIIVFLATCLHAAQKPAQLEQLSTRQTLEAILMLDIIQNVTYVEGNIYGETLINFQKLVGNSDFESETLSNIRIRLYELSKKHVAHESWYFKVYNLITFANVVLVLAVGSGSLFLLYLLSDLVINIAMIMVYVLANRSLLYMLGLALSFLLCYFKPDEMWQTSWWPFFIFDHQTSLFGSLIYTAVVGDWFSHNKMSEHLKNEGAVFILYMAGYVPIAIHQQNWLVGVMAVLALYAFSGFCFGSFPGGYYTGFKKNDVIFRCYLISVVMVGAFLYNASLNLNGEDLSVAIQTGQIGLNSHNSESPLMVFETGVMFIGTFVGLLAALILTDYDFMRGTKTADMYVPLQMFMFANCMVTMYFGIMFNYSTLKSIGGTFLVLWCLDVERIVLRQFKNQSRSGFWFTVTINLVALYWYMKTYPEYFIIGA